MILPARCEKPATHVKTKSLSRQALSEWGIFFMLSHDQQNHHRELKTLVRDACLKVFPEATCIMLWGGSATVDFDVSHSDVDVIIEIDQDISRENPLAEKLKTLVQNHPKLRLDPFVYTKRSSNTEALEFIAPFGFYKANPFIPYLVQNQHEILEGESELLKRLPHTTLHDAMVAYLPQVIMSLRRLRMDTEVEPDIHSILNKHKASLFTVLRSVYAFDHGKIGSKRTAIEYLSSKYPQYAALAQELSYSLRNERGESSAALNQQLVLAFAEDMAKALEAARRRETSAAH